MLTTRPIVARTLSVALLSGLFAAAGCDTGPRPPAGALQDPVLVGQYPNITLDGSLQKFLVVEYNAIVVQPPGPDRTLFLQVPLRNQADNEVAVQYEFVFFAQDGREVGRTNYMTAVLPSRRQVMLSGNAIVREAIAWRLDIRSAR